MNPLLSEDTRHLLSRKCSCVDNYVFCTTRALIAGGGAPEIEVSIRLAEHARTLTGMEAYCVRAFAEALEIIPYTLAENAGLNPIATVTELRNRHARNETTTGINVRKVGWVNTEGSKALISVTQLDNFAGPTTA